MTNRSDLISKTNKFINRLSKKPLWVFAWGLFIASLTFITSVLWNLNEQNANIAKFNSLTHIYEMDGRKAATVTATLNLVWSVAVEAASYFSSNIESNSDITSISNDVLKKGLELIHECREGINAELSVLQTIHFSDGAFTPFVEGFQKDLGALDRILAEKESIYRLLRERKYVEAKTKLRKLKTDPDYLKERQLNAALLRVSAFQNLAKLKTEEYAADLDLKKAQIKSFRVKVYLLIPVAGYMGAFTVIIVKRLKRAIVKDNA